MLSATVCTLFCVTLTTLTALSLNANGIMRIQTNATTIIAETKQHDIRSEERRVSQRDEKRLSAHMLPMPSMHHHSCTRLNEYGRTELVQMVRCVVVDMILFARSTDLYMVLLLVGMAFVPR